MPCYNATVQCCRQFRLSHARMRNQHKQWHEAKMSPCGTDPGAGAGATAEQVWLAGVWPGVARCGMAVSEVLCCA